MPKRRRIAHSPKAKTAEVVKEEKQKPDPEPEEPPATPPPLDSPEPNTAEYEEAAAAVQQLLASPGSFVAVPLAVPVTPTTAQLQTARTRLTGLLSRVVKPAGGAPTIEDSDSSQDDIPLAQSLLRAASPQESAAKVGSPAPAPVSKPKAEATSSTPSIKHIIKRRRRREAQVDSAFHHTYVMKLFDRSVDLAQFSETTSLYPVCRAWMKNQPRNPNLLPKRRTPSPTPSEEEEEEAKSDKDDDSTKDSNEEETIKSVYRMPPPICYVDLDSPIRVPSPTPHVVEPVKINQEAGDNGKDGLLLLGEHVARWREVKSKWMQAGHANEERYRDSINIIEDMYKKAQEMYT